MKQYKYRVNGKNYDVAIDEINGKNAKVTVNGISYDVEIEGLRKPFFLLTVPLSVN